MVRFKSVNNDTKNTLYELDAKLKEFAHTVIINIRLYGGVYGHLYGKWRAVFRL